MNSKLSTVTQADSNTKVKTPIIKYTGEWTSHQAAHLLRRTVYGPDQNEIGQAVSLGLDACVDHLLREISLPPPPLNFSDELDPFVAIGETWVNAGRNVGSNNKRRNSLRGWTVGRALTKEFHIREKLTTFWHNHFVVSDSNSANAMYMYITILRENALGNFKKMTKDITIDPSMLAYLNGNENQKESPNENFARELLELFTIGKGDLVAPGDYTNYTEEDIVVMAEILTGWRDRGHGDTTENSIHAEFRNYKHTKGSKQLSHRFNNAVIEEAGDQEYIQLIDVIFQQEEVARFICRNLFQWFVHYKITDEIELNVIEPLATLLYENNYEIRPVIKALLTSDHFYKEETIGCMIKNPLDFVVSGINSFNIELQTGLFLQYRSWLNVFSFVAANQMVYFNHPSVAGWKAYYQSPGYYHIWLSSATLPLRQEYTDLMAIGKKQQGLFFGIDVFGLLASMEEPDQINSLLNQIVSLIFPKPLSEDQLLNMKNAMLGGLPDFEWTIEYGNYLNNPDDEIVKTSVERKLRLLMLSMLRLPEYHMS